MLFEITMIMATAALVLATVITLASKPEIRARLVGAATLMAVIGGLFTYGYAYAVTSEYVPLSIIQAAMAVLGMFLGRNEYSLVADTPFFLSHATRLLFWLLHFFAMYATASTILTTLGISVLQRLRLFLANLYDVTVIYGVTPDTIAFGMEINSWSDAIVFVDENVSQEDYRIIVAEGGILCADSKALAAETGFLKKTGIRRGRRRVSLYALHPDHTKSLDYAYSFLTSLKKLDIRPEKTSLTLLGYEDILGEAFLNSERAYGYGAVTVFDEASMMARLLNRCFPPCNYLAFDGEGKAEEDFDALLVGFGALGQAVLDFMIMNGQFEGSHFHAAVFDPNYERLWGYMKHEQQEVLKQYEIEFYAEDARSSQMFEYIRSRKRSLKYIAVCMRNESLNTKLSQEIHRYLAKLSCRIPVFQCFDRGIRKLGNEENASEQINIYCADILCTEALDRVAMAVNHSYHRSEGRTAEESWERCDYFSRMSCRAFADFIPAILRASGTSMHEIQGEKNLPWLQKPKMLENLARTEHLRWCAFHHVMGYKTMTRETLYERARQFEEEKIRTGKGTISIAKDTDKRLHACLIPWEELEELSRFVSQTTGEAKDYKQIDADNILAVPELLEEASKRFVESCFYSVNQTSVADLSKTL